MPDESRASVVRRALAVARRLSVAHVAGLLTGIAVAALTLYAVSAAGAASTGARVASTPALANGGSSMGQPLFADRTPTMTATQTSSATPSLTLAPATATAAPAPSPAAVPTARPASTLPSVAAPPSVPAISPPTATASPPPPTSTPAPPPPASTPVPAATAPALTGLDTSPMDRYAQALFDDTNGRRVGAGLAPLRANGWLVGIARLRSQDMADHHYFAHVSPVTGDNAFTLMDKYGVPFGWAGENLAENNYPLSEAVSVADAALWNSPPHRENILNPNYTDMGIALAVDQSGMNYFTVIFTGPP